MQGRTTWMYFVVLCVSFDAAMCMASTPAEPPPPRRWALLVGCTDYPRLPIGFRLRGPANDVALLRGVLCARLGFDEADIVSLVSSNAPTLVPTRANIVREFESLVARAGPGDQVFILLVVGLGKHDTVLIMLSGHGQQIYVPLPGGGEKDEGFFCPYDAVDGRPDTLCSLSLLTDEVLAPNAGHSLLVIDACRNSGDTSRGKGIDGKVISLPEGVAVLFSCRKGQRSFEGDAVRRAHALSG